MSKKKSRLPSNKDGLDRVKAVIAPAALGRRLGLSRQAVNQWGAKVPERWVLRVSLITGIPPAEILPEVVREYQS